MLIWYLLGGLRVTLMQRQRLSGRWRFQPLDPGCYLARTKAMIRFFMCPPDELTLEDIHLYQLHLTRDRKVCGPDRDHVAADPHFWLDPRAMHDVVLALAPVMVEAGIDPGDRAAVTACIQAAFEKRQWRPPSGPRSRLRMRRPRFSSV